MTKPACMGGWCTRRNDCAAHTERDRTRVSERLCVRGSFNAFVPSTASVLARIPVAVLVTPFNQAHPLRRGIEEVA